LDGRGGGTGPALAGGFIEDDSSGGGDVQGADGAGHGDREKVVAGAAHEIVKAGAFAAEDDHKVAGEIELIVRGGAAFIETNDPEVAALELFERADEVDDTGNAQVFGRSSARFDGGRTERCGTPLGEENAVDTCAIGDAKESAKILRIFNAVEGEQEPSGRIAVGMWREEIFEREKPLRANERDDTLVRGSLRCNGELLARFFKHANACIAALGDEMIEAVIFALAGDEDVVEAAAAGLESFSDRMQAVENFHGISLVAALAMRSAWRWPVD
jgi:hypothetical protein